MPFPLIPVVLGAGTLAAWYKVKKKKKMTPELQATFENAIKNVKDADKLDALAETFEKKGLRAEGGELRKRAKILRLPPEKKQEYRQAYKAGLSSDNPNKIKALADAFHKQGFYGSAKNLRDYAHGLAERAVKTVMPGGHKSNVPSEHKSDFAPNVALQVGENASDSDSSISNDG